MAEDAHKHMAEIGRKGGHRSRRALTADEARAMVRVREARRAFRQFATECFWSYDPEYVVGPDDVEWVADTLMRTGGRAAWEAGARLCR